MEVRPHRTINRRKTKEIKVGNISVGGNSQISIQSMTNTLTTDVKGTIKQIHSLEDAGADIVRVSCPDEESTKALKKIVHEVNVPIVADIHFHYKRAIEAAKMGASCLRINPGNIGNSDRVLEVVKAAKDVAKVEFLKKRVGLPLPYTTYYDGTSLLLLQSQFAVQRLRNALHAEHEQQPGRVARKNLAVESVGNCCWLVLPRVVRVAEVMESDEELGERPRAKVVKENLQECEEAALISLVTVLQRQVDAVVARGRHRGGSESGRGGRSRTRSTLRLR